MLLPSPLFFLLLLLLRRVHAHHLVVHVIVKAVQKLVEKPKMAVAPLGKEAVAARNLAAVVVLDAHVQAAPVPLHLVEDGQRLPKHLRIGGLVGRPQNALHHFD